MPTLRKYFINLTIELSARPGKTQELSQALLAFLPAIRKVKGCRGTSLYNDAEDKNNFSLSMLWDNNTALEQYMLSLSGSAFLGAIDLLGEKVKVRVGGELPWEGLDVLKRMRSHVA